METKAYLGIDVSKGYADFILLDEQQEVIESVFQLPDDTAGRKRLKELIEKWFTLGLQELYCGVESTGGYENNWYGSLKGLGEVYNIFTARLNAKGVKSVSDATLKRTITDAVSADSIARYLICFPNKIDYGRDRKVLHSKFSDARQQYSYLRMLTKQKVQLVNQLEKLLYQNFSEMIVYCRHGIPDWAALLLSKFPCAKAVNKASQRSLCKIPNLTVAKAEVLVSKCQNSTQSPSSQIQHIISATAAEIIHKKEMIELEKKYLADIYRDTEEVRLLTTIKGIGVDTAVAILMEIEDIGRFETSKKLTSYFGVHPSYKQSGDGVWGNHMSKKGRPEIRAALFMAALTGIRFNPILKDLYARFRAKGLKHYPAMGIAMHKLLRIIYGILKNKQPFDVTVDEKNVQSAQEKQVEKEQERAEIHRMIKEKKGRYLPVTNKAPISRKAAQKISKQLKATSMLVTLKC